MDNKWESEFDALAAKTSSPATGSSDPWVSPGTTDSTNQNTSSSNDAAALFGPDLTSTLEEPPSTSTQNDLQELDLFSNQPVVAKKKEEILNLFGSQPQSGAGFPPNQGFGANIPGAQNPMHFGGVFSAGVPTGGMPQPTGVPNPFAAPFGVPGVSTCSVKLWSYVDTIYISETFLVIRPFEKTGHIME